MRYIGLYILFSSIICFRLDAQERNAARSFTKADVREMFPQNTKNLWINYLSGMIDHKHVVDMIIGSDGHSCKGLYMLRSSNTTFFFEGQDLGKHLRMAELNGEGRLTGFIDGKYDGSTFDGNWTNKDKNLSYPLKLSFVNAFENYNPEGILNNQWIRSYRENGFQSPYVLQIKREPKQFVCKYTQKGGTKQIKRSHVNGSRIEILAPSFDTSLLSNKWIMMDTSNFEKIDVIYPEENGYEVLSSLRLDEAVEYVLYEYADFHSRMECITPKTRSKRFDTWINSIFKSWLSDHIKKFKNTHQDEAGTNERWIQNAYGWVEVELFENDIISGTIYMQSSLSTKTEKIAFIYDIRYGNELKLQDLFDSKFDSKSYFGLLIPEMVQISKWTEDVRHHFKNQSFNTVCLKEEGISFSTQFNTIYGEKEILIPYEKVRQHLRPRYNF